MTYQKRPNSGTLGKNKNKQADNHPEYSGALNVEGVDYWISGWVKENRESGERFFSLSVKRKDERKASPAITAKPSKMDEPDDDLPF